MQRELIIVTFWSQETVLDEFGEVTAKVNQVQNFHWYVGLRKVVDVGAYGRALAAGCAAQPGGVDGGGV